MSTDSPVTHLTRDVEAIQIPSGLTKKLVKGTPVIITQALGGTYTIVVEHSAGLFRILAADADALGKVHVHDEPAKNGTGKVDGPLNEDDIWTQLKTCYDPEIPVNIVDLGLVYECEVTKNEDATRSVDIKMTLTAPGCGMGEVLVADVRDKVQIVPTVVRAHVELVFDPPWNQTMMSEEARLQTGMM
jgi:probable FeS assembly SUF system protein SufT